VNPPARSIRTELNDALIGAIRQRGPEAFGMMITGLARLVVGAFTFAVLFGISRLADYQVTAFPFAGMASISAWVSWAATWRRKPGD
jgi:hypothetical protein